MAKSVAPEHFLLDFATDIDGVGVITLNITRAWSPIGVDHLFKLVNDGFYDESAFTRVDGGFVLQFGISGIPANNVKYNQSIKNSQYNNFIDDFTRLSDIFITPSQPLFIIFQADFEGIPQSFSNT